MLGSCPLMGFYRMDHCRGNHHCPLFVWISGYVSGTPMNQSAWWDYTILLFIWRVILPRIGAHHNTLWWSWIFRKFRIPGVELVQCCGFRRWRFLQHSNCTFSSSPTTVLLTKNNPMRYLAWRQSGNWHQIPHGDRVYQIAWGPLAWAIDASLHSHNNVSTTISFDIICTHVVKASSQPMRSPWTLEWAYQCAKMELK